MARRRRDRAGSRDAFAISSPLLRSVYLPIEPDEVSPLQELEDRRLFHPLQEVAPARASVRSSSRLVPSRVGALPYSLKFEDPVRVAVCVRRKRRREVIFAKGRSGAGGRSPRWSEYSSIGCKS